MRFEQQIALLQRQVKWAAEKSSFYRDSFARVGISYEHIKEFADWARLPLLERMGEKGATAPFLMPTLPFSGLFRMSVLRDCSAESADCVVCYTQGDIARQVQAATTMLSICGVNRAATVLLCGNFGDSRTLDLQYALESIGATVLPGNDGERAAASRLMETAVPDTIIAWEENLPFLSELLYGQKDRHLHRLISVGDSIELGALARRIGERTGTQCAHIFTLAHMGALLGCSCKEGVGIHLNEGLFFAEVIDTAGESHIESGACGELVLSALTAEAVSILRFRTGRYVRLQRDMCACGNVSLRIIGVNHVR